MPKKSKRRSKSSRRSKLLGKVVPPNTNRHTAMRLVYQGKYEKTRGGLRKKDITRKYIGVGPDGKRQYRYISKRKQRIGQRLQRAYPYQDNAKFVRNIGSLPNMRK